MPALVFHSLKNILTRDVFIELPVGSNLVIPPRYHNEDVGVFVSPSPCKAFTCWKLRGFEPENIPEDYDIDSHACLGTCYIKQEDSSLKTCVVFVEMMYPEDGVISGISNMSTRLLEK